MKNAGMHHSHNPPGMHRVGMLRVKTHRVVSHGRRIDNHTICTQEKMSLTFPASICAMIPMFLYVSRGTSRGTAASKTAASEKRPCCDIGKHNWQPLHLRLHSPEMPGLLVCQWIRRDRT